jgi:hypothetical protein
LACDFSQTNAFVLVKQRARVRSAASSATPLHIAYTATSIIHTNRKKRSFLNCSKTIMEVTNIERLRKAGSAQVAHREVEEIFVHSFLDLTYW